MSKQIKIIWILSLISVLLLIGLQGYWLFNQYEYVLNGYSDEIAAQVLQAGEDEYLVRRNNNSTSMMASNFIMQTNKVGYADQKTHVSIGVRENDSIMESDSVFIKSFQFQQLRGGNDQDIADTDSQSIKLSYYTNLTGEALRSAMEKAFTNQSNPFEPAQFDSILVSLLPAVEYAIVPWDEDYIDEGSNVLQKRTGSLFNPRLTVSYPYSPLDNLGVFVFITLPIQPVFYRMGIQLFVAVGITFLLIACLIFQVRTILKQKKVNEIREDFVNTMVHELKRPVQTLKTFVSFLNDKKMRSDVEATEQVVRDAMFELDNLSAYLNKLKDMLQVDDETTSLHPVRFNLPDLVEKVIRLTHIPSDKEVNIKPVYETDEMYMEADPIHFANVLSNLIENSIKCSGDKVNIEIKVGQDKRKIRVSVKDDGIGIPVTEQDRVFAKFYRGNNIPDKTVPGIGLGLSYVKLIIEAHQGSIQLDSQVSEGTTITLNLPQ
jgi:two-component system phosphate regulon sensor histidine kinase PhoR